MNALAVEWVAKAEGDFATSRRELRARKLPNYDAACFHAHQCAEKYLKARLQLHGTRFPRTHNLNDLLDLCLHYDETLRPWRDTALALNAYGSRYRYPGEMADKTLRYTDTARRDLAELPGNYRQRFRRAIEALAARQASNLQTFDHTPSSPLRPRQVHRRLADRDPHHSIIIGSDEPLRAQMIHHRDFAAPGRDRTRVERNRRFGRIYAARA